MGLANQTALRLVSRPTRFFRFGIGNLYFSIRTEKCSIAMCYTEMDLEVSDAIKNNLFKNVQG